MKLESVNEISMKLSAMHGPRHSPKKIFVVDSGQQELYLRMGKRFFDSFARSKQHARKEDTQEDLFPQQRIAHYAIWNSLRYLNYIHHESQQNLKPKHD